MNDEARTTGYGARDARGSSTQPTGITQHRVLTSEGYALVDAHLQIRAADAVVREWLGGGADGGAEPRVTLDQLVIADDLAGNIRRALDSDKVVSFVARLRGKADADAQAHVTLRPLVGDNSPFVLAAIDSAPPGGVLALDALTQLPDRREIARRIAQWRRAAGETLPRFAVLFLDLDEFKTVNDQFGHAVGDAVLRELSARWQQCVRDDDLVSRYGGDEFVLLIRDAAAPRDVLPLIARLQAATSAPVVVGAIEHRVNATIGAALATDDARSIDELIAAADRDMYARKPRVLR